MKLTREGAARLGRHESRGFPVGDFEFRPEDFDDCYRNWKEHVVLTVDEAKLIWDILEDNENYFPEGFWEMADWLKNKIEQAEKENE